jgi:hypothetical protein
MRLLALNILSSGELIADKIRKELPNEDTEVIREIFTSELAPLLRKLEDPNEIARVITYYRVNKYGVRIGWTGEQKFLAKFQEVRAKMVG